MYGRHSVSEGAGKSVTDDLSPSKKVSTTEWELEDATATSVPVVPPEGWESARS
eukprot:COSAG02_NODE_12482_length_1536_cov_0.543750_1_plen_53_part_10